MEVYCVKEKRHTPNVQESEKVAITKNNRKLLKVKCASCGITKTRFMPGEPSRAEGSGIFGDVAMAVGDLAITKGIPYLAKKSVEAGRYYASEAMRDPKLQKKAINYTLDKARPVIQKVGSEMLDQLSTEVRPNQRYKTDRPDLDGAGFDIHAAIGKFPKPKKGWTLPEHNFTGPYNPLEKLVKYDPETGEILEIYQPPTDATDAIAMQHDVDYDVCSNREKKYGENLKKCKHKVDKKMVKNLDAVPYKQRQWGHAAARHTINTKQKLGLGLKQQKRTGVLDKPLDAIKFAETLTKKNDSFHNTCIRSLNWKGDIAKNAFTGPTGVTSKKFGLIQKKVLSCAW